MSELALQVKLFKAVCKLRNTHTGVAQPTDIITAVKCAIRLWVAFKMFANHIFLMLVIHRSASGYANKRTEPFPMSF